MLEYAFMSGWFLVVYFHSCLSAHVVVCLMGCFITDCIERLSKAQDVCLLGFRVGEA